jgi:hypothetical protein
MMISIAAVATMFVRSYAMTPYEYAPMQMTPPADTTANHHTRWKIKRTVPIVTSDLDTSALDLKTPGNIMQKVIYNDSLNEYYIGSKIGDSYLNTPVLMSPDEYRKWSEKKEMSDFFRKKNAENVANKGYEI